MVLITGASGFIGVRLAQCLARDHGEQVRALVHRLGTVGGARLATLSHVEIMHGDVRDAASVDEAARGCRAIVHCAVDVSSPIAVREDVTTRGTANVLRASSTHRVGRIIFLSTAAVHSWIAPGQWDEDAPVRASDYYSRSKLQAEALLLENSDIPVTIIRPTCVYGPFSRTWTVTPVEFLRLGIPLVAEDGAGSANLIYIDNLVDLILAALDRQPGGHTVYLANDEQPTSWETLYSAYARAVDVPLRRFRPDASAWGALREELSVSWTNGKLLVPRVAAGIAATLVAGLKDCHRHVPLLQRCDRFLPMDSLRRKVASSPRSTLNVGDGGGADTVRPYAPRELRSFYASRATFSAARARRELGWAPRITAPDAIERTCAWIKAANL